MLFKFGYVRAYPVSFIERFGSQCELKISISGQHKIVYLIS